MWAYPLAPRERRRSWALPWATVLIWGVLVGRGFMEAAADPLSGKAAGPGRCPTIHRYIPRDSKAFIPIARSKGFSILCRVNASSRCEWVLLVNRGRAYYFNMDLKDHLILHNKGLVVKHMSKELEGEYLVLSGLNRTCDGQVLLTAVGPLFLYRIFLLLPAIMFLGGLGALWDWLVIERNRLSASEEEQNINNRIQHVFPPLDFNSNL